MFLVILIALLWALPSVVRIYGPTGERRYRDEGWIRPTGGWALGALAVAATVIILWLITLLAVPATIYGAERGTSDLTTIVIMLPAAAIWAVGEELFFRGWLLGLLHRRMSGTRAVLLQAAAYALMYALTLLVDPGMWVLVPYQFASAVLYGELRRRSGSVWVAVIAHAVAMVVTVATLL